MTAAQLLLILAAAIAVFGATRLIPGDNRDDFGRSLAVWFALAAVGVTIWLLA